MVRKWRNLLAQAFGFHFGNVLWCPTFSAAHIFLFRNERAHDHMVITCMEFMTIVSLAGALSLGVRRLLGVMCARMETYQPNTQFQLREKIEYHKNNSTRNNFIITPIDPHKHIMDWDGHHCQKNFWKKSDRIRRIWRILWWSRCNILLRRFGTHSLHMQWMSPKSSQ